MIARSVLPLNGTLFRPGMRVGVAVSGGADSVALLLALLEQAGGMGIVLSVAHVHHGLRGAESDADEVFVQELAVAHDLECRVLHCDTRAAASANREGIEECARRLRYGFFRSLLADGLVDAVATAHTLDDQAETVLMKLLRGAWTEGLGGIHPVLKVVGGGLILRPLLAVRREQVEAFLKQRDQPWREDASNRELIYTRNRVRNQLLPSLMEYSPQIYGKLAAVSAIARDEEAYWQAELASLLPLLLLPGKAVRGGGRASSTSPGQASVAIELERLRLLHPAMRRRVLRAAMEQLGRAADFDQTESLLALCGFAGGKMPARLELSGGIRAERTPRELRLECRPVGGEGNPAEYTLPIPGDALAERFGLAFRSSCNTEEGPSVATIRMARAGDRVILRHCSGTKKVKEVLEKMNIAAQDRRTWPVVEWKGSIVWMRGAEVESELGEASGLIISVSTIEAAPNGT